MDVGLVCDRCDTYNPMAAPACATCGGALSLEAPPETTAPAAPAPAMQRACKSCGNPLPAGYKFCGACGARVETQRPVGARPTNFFSAIQQERAKLVLVKGDGLDGVTYTLAGEEHLAGRVEGPLLFPDDPFLSPRHANFYYKDHQLWVRDETSANGVFVRIRGPATLLTTQTGDTFLVGEQVMRVQITPPEGAGLGPDVEGTYVFASPRRPSRMRIIQLLRGGDVGMVVRAKGDLVTLGRDENDMNFPDDPFISGHHAQVAVTDAGIVLTDLGSKNGTFLRITRDTHLAHGDYVFIGQQLLRVEIV